MSIPQNPGPPPMPAAAPVPPARPPRRRWMVLGAVAVVVALAGVAATLYATGVFGSADEGGAKITEADGDKPTSVDELSSPSAEDEPAKYRYKNGACEQVDWKPLEKLTGLDADDIEPTYEPSNGDATVKCVVDESGTDSAYNVEIHIYDTVAAAEEKYESMLADSEGKDEADGPWNQGLWAAAEVTDGSAGVYLRAQDSNMYLVFGAGSDGDDDVENLQEHVVDASEDLLAAITVKG